MPSPLGTDDLAPAWPGTARSVDTSPDHHCREERGTPESRPRECSPRAANRQVHQLPQAERWRLDPPMRRVDPPPYTEHAWRGVAGYAHRSRRGSQGREAKIEP